MGHRVVCISIESAEDNHLITDSLGVEYYQVGGSRTGIGIKEGLAMIKAYTHAFREINPDYVFLYMSKPVAFGGPAAIRAGVPHINVLVNGLENAYYRTGIKDWIVRMVMSTTYRYVGRHADNVFIQNHDDCQLFIDKKINDGHNLHVVNGSGVDMQHFSKCPLPAGPIFLMVARLLWSKGIREYLEAIKIVKDRYPDARFKLVGGLDHNDESLSESELNIAIQDYDIEYCGFAHDVRPHIAESSVFVLPSYHEGTPRCVLEAMSMGRAIITTDAPGCKETVDDGHNGYIVPVKDSTALAEAMIKLCDNADLRHTMGEMSHKMCLEKFEVGKVNDFICSKMGLL